MRSLTRLIFILTLISCVILWQGCGDDEPDSWNLEPKSTVSYESRTISTQPYPRYQASYPRYNPQLVVPEQPPLPFGGSSLPQVDPSRLENLQQSAGRINDKREDLKRVLAELDMEQRQYQTDLQTVNSDYERNKQVIVDEYSRYLQSLRSMAAFQVNYPRDQVYVNAYQGSTVSGVKDLNPFPLPSSSPYSVAAAPSLTSSLLTTSSIVTTPAAVVDYTEYTSSLLSFIENCLSLSTSSPQITSELKTIKTEILASSQSSVSFLADRATRVNALLTQINKLPRESTLSEVWVDPQSVSGRADQVKLDQLVMQESKSKVALTGMAIPDLFSLANTQDTRAHRLKVFRDRKSRQIKLIATCFYKRFARHRGERFFLAFTCPDTDNSFTALTATGKNRLSESALKVICHSKKFAKRLVLEAKTTRCSISEWSVIVEGLSGDTKFKDRSGKAAWNALKQGTGCFSKKDSEITSNCRNGKRSKKDKNDD